MYRLSTNVARQIYLSSLIKPYDKLTHECREIIESLVEDISVKVKNTIESNTVIKIELYTEVFNKIGKEYNLADGLLSNLIVALSYRITDLLLQYKNTGIIYFDHWALEATGHILIRIFGNILKDILPYDYRVENSWLHHIDVEIENITLDTRELLSPNINRFFKTLIAHDNMRPDEPITIDAYKTMLKKRLTKKT